MGPESGKMRALCGRLQFVEASSPPHFVILVGRSKTGIHRDGEYVGSEKNSLLHALSNMCWLVSSQKPAIYIFNKLKKHKSNT